MSIQNSGHNKWTVRVRRRTGGKALSKTKIVHGSRLEAMKAEVQLTEELVYAAEQRSFSISTFGEALSYYLENTEADTERWRTYYDRLNRDLGAVRIRDLTNRFAVYWRLLRNERAQRTGEILSPATRNHILVAGKVALNLCVKRGLIERNPLNAFDKVPEEGRDRILGEDEEARILEVMKRRDSHLYWPFYFSRWNPIRKGDLLGLTRENLDLFKPWVHFYASKTRKRRNRETCLPFLDEPLLQYFKSLPPDCPLLFPRIDAKGNWHRMGDFKTHWNSILEEAKIEDFHWHDLKHCAITRLLDSGYTERDLKNLGIQYTASMIDRYYKSDASKVLSKWKKGSDCGHVAKSSHTKTP